ncbi:hypothetical protein I302_106148 [Kwoniella bestiolae CBS 10118]|uniref:Uncharacterized protein n=1 Tax=Kwoniella bestiolae CBS 10118 TaxID=1296100 RepID=A0A1B9G373_9TREE|nr:hypothetical protein I302_05271 [Kwoniella bestiolae CBS 10118]OCF25451.1 hypothetical protein I302_05271 [Kwoniella bestiolae CBS 10118]
MSNSGRNVGGWSRETPPHISRLKIVSPARPAGGTSNPPPIPYRQRPYIQSIPGRPARIPSWNNPAMGAYQDIRHTDSGNHNEVHHPQPNLHTDIQSPRPYRLPESFKESLLIVDNDPNPPQSSTANQTWKSRRAKIQQPALEPANQGRAPRIPFSARGSTSSMSSIQYGNQSMYPMGDQSEPPVSQYGPVRDNQALPHGLYGRNHCPNHPMRFSAPQPLRDIPTFRNPADTRSFISRPQSSFDQGQQGTNFNVDRPLFSRLSHPPPIPHFNSNPPISILKRAASIPTPTSTPTLQTGYINLDYLHYLQLARLSCDDQILLRVHSQSSISPLIWSGDMKTSGFFATSSVFQQLTPKSYEALFKSYQSDEHFRDEGWLKRPLMREIMIDHILCRPSRKLVTVNLKSITDLSKVVRDEGEGGRGDYWISTTRSIDWAVFEIARRLAFCLVSGGVEGDKKVRLAVINRNQTIPRNGKCDSQKGESRIAERTINPYLCLTAYESNILSPSKLEASIHARKRAKDSYEILYWGRVFGENIQQDLVFTPDYLPFKLPSKFWRPATSVNSPSNIPGWLGRLRWDPVGDDWPAAVRCLREKVYPTTKWVHQPVHKLASTWPPDSIEPTPGLPVSEHEQGTGAETMSKIVSDEDEEDAEADRVGSSRSEVSLLLGQEDDRPKKAVVDLMS